MTETRVLNRIAVEACEKALKRGETPAVVYEAPTGYGKTALSMAFYATLARHRSASGLIHVLPMMSIAVELYCKIVNALGGSDERCKCFRTDEIISKYVREAGVSRDDVGYQFMDFIDQSKSPFFLKTFLITTFNSFFHNLSRFPVGELRKYKKHYEVARAAILTSGVVFDEAHLYGGDPGAGDEKSLITAFAVSVKALAEARVPMLIESATLPEVFRELLKRVLKDSGLAPRLVSFRYGTRKCDQECADDSELVCYDEEYVSKCSNVKWVTEVVDEERVKEIVKEHVSSGRKVLVVRNTVAKAVKTYRELKDTLGDVELIHGRFTREDRASKLLKLRKCEGSDGSGECETPTPKVVVSTQVIEAGVNLSFDALLTDSASPSSVVQRAGRVARGCGTSEGYVYVIKSDGDGVYDERVVGTFVSRLLEHLRRGHRVDWRIPFVDFSADRVSFMRLIDESYRDVEIDLDPSRYVHFRDLVSGLVETLSHEDLIRTYKKLGGLLKSSLLFPVYVGDSPPKDLRELYDLSVPLSPEFVAKHSSSLLRMRGDGVSVIVLKCDEDLSKCELDKGVAGRDAVGDYTRWLMTSWKDHSYTLFPLSLWGRSEVYSKEVGLVLEA